MVGDFHARVGKSGQAGDIIGQCGEDRKNTNEVEMLNFLENSEMKTPKDRAQSPEAQRVWTRECKKDRERSALDYGVPRR